MKIKTSELTGPALGWASAVADKRQVRAGIGGSVEVRGRTESNDELPEDYDLWMFWYPQADWSQAGPIIEREGIGLLFDSGSACREPGWFATPDDQCTQESYEGERFDPAFMVDESAGTRGPTPLIAAMRCYVASKLGDEVDVPEEFLNG